MTRRYCLPILLFLFIASELFYKGPANMLLAASVPFQNSIAAPTPNREKEIYNEYIKCFESVYETMDKNYYRPITREIFNRFIVKFDKDIYGKLDKKDEKSNYVCWRSSAYLVDYLKDKGDTFSAFFPPKAAEKFEKKVLGEKVDLGIEGQLTQAGYLVTRVEPRSDAYAKGLKNDDIIQMINKVKVVTLKIEAIQEMLTPLINTTVMLDYLEHETKAVKTIKVISQEYFKQTVFMVPVNIPGVYGLEIKSFNQKTAEDLFRYLSLIEKNKESYLILDLRGNPGGPPLAAQEISAFFLSTGEQLAYFQKKGHPKAMLAAPGIADEQRYKGPIAILVNKDSGSAAELFSGFMQKHKRATLIGMNTAGKVFLKSMFPFDDGSMLLLVTARGYFPDDSVFDFNGVVPDVAVADEKIDLIKFAADYLKSQRNIQLQN